MKKAMKSKTFQSYFILLVFLLFIEIIFNILSQRTIFNNSFWYVFLLINIISIFFGYLTSLTKPKVMTFLNTSIILLFSIYAFLQLGFYNFLGVYMSFSTSSQFNAVVEYINDFLHSIKISYYYIFIPFIILLIGYILNVFYSHKAEKLLKLKIHYKYENTITLLIVLIALISLTSIFYFSLDNTDDYAINDKELFLSLSNPTLYVNKFGIISYIFLDIKADMIGTKDGSLSYLALVTEEKDYSRQLDDTSWLTLIEEENNQTYNNLNNYFINNSITDKNDYTGYFQDKNLIVLMLESVNDIIYNEEYFPNFYKLASEGWYFENNYSPRNSCATGNNEFSALTGLYSIYNNCTTNIYANNVYPNALFNLFNNAGYYTNSFHNYTEHYYARETYHLNMGSIKYYGVESLGIDYSTIYGQWSSDEDLMKAYLNILDKRENGNFMSFITTVSSHQPYSVSSTYGDIYLDMSEDTDYPLEIRRYLSKLKVVDNAIGILVNGLEERNLLDDTVIVIFGDHYPYGIDLETLGTIMTRDLNDYENEKVPLVIYNPSLSAKVYDTYTSYINLTPTIANLFDLDFDPRLYMGVDIFSDDYNNTVSFANLSWKNNLAYYDALTNNIIYFTDFIYSEDEIKNMNTYFYSKTNASALAIKNDYFNYLAERLKEINDRKENE